MARITIATLNFSLKQREPGAVSTVSFEQEPEGGFYPRGGLAGPQPDEIEPPAARGMEAHRPGARAAHHHTHAGHIHHEHPGVPVGGHAPHPHHPTHPAPHAVPHPHHHFHAPPSPLPPPEPVKRHEGASPADHSRRQREMAQAPLPPPRPQEGGQKPPRHVFPHHGVQGMGPFLPRPGAKVDPNKPDPHTAPAAPQGGESRSYHNKNPGNVRYGEFAKSHGAVGQDEKGFAIFPSVEAGEKAQRELWESKYANVPFSRALPRWSHGGYGPEKFGLPPEGTWAGLNDEQKSKLLQDQRRLEGWYGPSGAPTAPSGGISQFNFMRGQFGAPGTNLVTFTTRGGLRVTAHKLAAPHMRGFLEELEAVGAPMRQSMVAAYNFRTMHGKKTLSQHAYGNALDIESSGRNIVSPEFNAWARTHKAELEAAEKKWGMISGRFMSKPDWGHWEWTGEPLPAPMAAEPPHPQQLEAARRAAEARSRLLKQGERMENRVPDSYHWAPPGQETFMRQAPGDSRKGTDHFIRHNPHPALGDEGMERDPNEIKKKMLNQRLIEARAQLAKKPTKPA